MKKLIGPFTEIVTLAGLPLKGTITDDQLQVIANGGIVVENGILIAIGNFRKLHSLHPGIPLEAIKDKHVLLPGFIDCHTHMCFAGNRARDYSLRIQGKSYLEIAHGGGGIWDSVTQTRQADQQLLKDLLQQRVQRHIKDGVTTIEVKSGYGLNLENELKQLRVIREVNMMEAADLVPTCLAAHLLPKDFSGSAREYLDMLLHKLLPAIQAEKLSKRVDIFIEESAFTAADASYYLQQARDMGFELTVHADQFSSGGLEAAVKSGALSADHLEASTEIDINLLATSDTVAVVLPGASLGLGMHFAPARKLLDAGASVAIASDWNPGSAPMGDLLMQAAVMSAAQKLSAAEVFAGLTFRAARALNLSDRGKLEKGMLADMQAYPCADYREILYHQGKMKPAQVWKNGKAITFS